MLTNSSPSELKPIQLGKKIELKYIPFSELAVPWNIVAETAFNPEADPAIKTKESTFQQIKENAAKASKRIDRSEMEALKRSIAKFGLLKPFEVAELHERLSFFYGKGKYFIIDGQRRYFAIRDLLKLPTEHDEKRQIGTLRTQTDDEGVINSELQAQELLDRTSVRNYVLVPCIVYPYTTHLQMVRHSIEDKRFSEKPPKEDHELVERMSEQGIQDLHPDDLRELWNIRHRIDEAKQSIEKTLEEIRNRIGQKTQLDGILTENEISVE